ncbi:Ankyrin-1-like 6 [Homarus americanus]|uniref:XK-related protein n=1 Tax=Homarus americanus TaxID=6706 RepID=A0A8J5NC22_HOMAM|nr:Ankyrin-1-like 6 [Homarus americanus]
MKGVVCCCRDVTLDINTRTVTHNGKMTVDSGGGGMGGGCDTAVETEGHEKEMHAHLIHYHPSFSSQASPTLCCLTGLNFTNSSSQPLSYLIQYQTPNRRSSRGTPFLDISESNHASASLMGWLNQSQDPGTGPEDITVDDPENLTTLWPDDPDSGHPFTRAALQGDVSTVKDFVSRQTFDPSSKKAQHALLVACRTGNVELTQVLLNAGVDVHCKDAKSGWQPIHIATYRDHVAVVEALAMHGEWRRGVALGVTALHVAAYRDHTNIVRFLLSRGANPKMIVKSPTSAWRTPSLDTLFRKRHRWSPTQAQASLSDLSSARDDSTVKGNKWKEKPRSSVNVTSLTSSEWPANNLRTERGLERVEPIIKFHVGSTLLHWAAGQGYDDLVADLLARGLVVDSGDRLGRTPLGLAVWAGHTSIVNTLLQEKVSLSEDDKDWRSITREEVGLCIVKVIEETAVCALDASRSDGFTLLHLAAQHGYPNMMHRLLSLKVSPDVKNNHGETPLFVAIRSNQLACVQQLINAGTRLSIMDNRGGSALHMAAKNGNVTVIDMLLTTSELEERDVDINRCDNIGYTPIYYAINASRYDIVQRFLEYSLVRKVHVKATNGETLLQFYTERNNLGQYDNAVVRVLECEKFLHTTKASAELCLRVQLGTTEASSKARTQLQAMYESTKAQRHCWNFWFFLSCFLLPSVFYYLDVYTDILLAVEYYQDYMLNLNLTDYSGDNQTQDEEALAEFEEEYRRKFMDIFEDITDSQYKINFVLTMFFILLPITLLSMWNLYIHVTQPDILPVFRRLPSFLRMSVYTIIFLTPLAPVMAYLENTYAQMKHMNVTARQMQEVDSKSYNSFPTHGNTKTYRHHMRDMKIRKYYDLKHVAQMRVAITNVMEATLESAFQLILQLYIVGTRYNELDKVKDVTLGSILSLSPHGTETQLSKQVFSVLISLVSLTWSFTSYHRFSKLGGLTILNALPLLFAIFFQVVSRAIACTLFTLAYTWKVFVVLGIHFVIVLVFKLKLEERSVLPVRNNLCCHCFLAYLRPYFYVFLGTIASTLVYFRLERPSAVKKQLSRRHSTVVIQVLFLILAFVENLVLLSLGIVGLDKVKYDNTFIIISAVLCAISYLTGVILHGVYYGCFGHPWVDINGPSVTRDPDEGTLVLQYYRQGQVT